jgi:hypothetical protein
VSGSILFCTYSHNVWGGIETWLHEMLAAHREAGWTTTLAVARGRRFNDPGRFARAFGDIVVSFDGRTGTAKGRITAVQRLIEKVNPSIVVPIGVGHARSCPVFRRASRCRCTRSMRGSSPMPKPSPPSSIWSSASTGFKRVT